MNLPNRLTILRIILVPIFVVVVLLRVKYGDFFAALIFSVAAVTDTLDGYIARRYNMVTRFGKLMDPLADKLLVTAALIALVELGRINTWIALVIIGREFAITGLRSLAAADGVVISASSWGKWKTVSQIAAILLTLLIVDLEHLVAPWMYYVAQMTMGIAVALTIWSAIDYFIHFYRGHASARRT